MNKKIAVDMKAVSAGDFITCKEAAAILKISEISVRRFLTQKKLRRYKCGARTLVSHSEVSSLIRVSE